MASKRKRGFEEVLKAYDIHRNKEHRQELKKAYKEGRESLVRDFKRWLKGRNINVREKDMIRGWLNEKK